MAAPSDPQRDAESKQTTVIAVVAAFASLSAIAVSLRMYTRQFVLRATGADDWTMLAAAVKTLPSHISPALKTAINIFTRSC